MRTIKYEYQGRFLCEDCGTNCGVMKYKQIITEGKDSVKFDIYVCNECLQKREDEDEEENEEES